MKNRYLLLLIRLAGLSVFLIALTLQAVAQRPSELDFPDTPCDSIRCLSLYIKNTSIVPEQLTEVRIQDSTNYTIAPGFNVAQTIFPGDSVGIPICFAPSRRGRIVDSMVVVINTLNGPDFALVRIAGRGISPSLQVNPIVVNFPKTPITTVSTQRMVIKNQGELPYELTTASLNLPLPFRVQNTLPLMVMPGDSVELLIEFAPETNGVYSVTIDLQISCGVTQQLGVNGVTDLIGTGAVLRLTKGGFNPSNNERTPCDIPVCTEVTLSNTGNAPLLIEDIKWLDGNQQFAFTTNPQPPFTIAPNDRRVLEVCAGSDRRAVLEDTIMVTSNSRSSIAFGMVIDLSLSMTQNMKCGADSVSRISQAILQANNFIQRTLLHIASIGIQDQLAINTYSSILAGIIVRIKHIFHLNYITDVTRAQAQASLVGLIAEGTTPTGAAVRSMIDTLAKSPLHNRVIVLLTDGPADLYDREKHPLDTVIQHANRYGVRVYTIGLGSGLGGPNGDYLRMLAGGTNGVAFDASDGDCITLQNAFEAITTEVSRGATMTSPFALRVISPAVAATQMLSFDSVYVHGSRCSTMTLANIGEGEAIVDDIAFSDMNGGTTSEFYLGPGVTLPLRIPEGEEITIPICFTADSIRMRYGKATFRYNNCGQNPASSSFAGAAYAVTNLRITDQRIGLPDDIVTLPITIDSSLTAYGVNTMSFELRWNRTMLDLRTLRPGPAAGGATVALDGPVTYTGGDAVARINVTGAQVTGAGELAELEFLVLRGDALSTQITLREGLFQDDNPRRILVNSGIVGFDSTCFREAKPVSTGGAIKMVVGDAGPVPSSGRSVTIPVSADGAMMVALELYSADGSLARSPETFDFAEGRGNLQVDLSGLASGNYYAVLKSSTGETFLRKILVAR